MLHQVTSSYGRMPSKPENEVQKEEVQDDQVIPIQDQIENLRTKISLKERYNKVLKDDLEESREGTTSFLRDLYKETMQLRGDFMDAIMAEKNAVQSALRTHREFQLALLDRNPGVALGWLDDKIFDSSKQFDVILNDLADKRERLEESESMVIQIEKWPRPGTLPWERKMFTNMINLENLIEAMKVKRETAFILHSKYKEVRMTLREEKTKYGPILRNLENQLKFHRQELQGIERVVDDAAHFRIDAAKNLNLTEKEASENRKKRRKQMMKMKRAVQTILEANNQQKDTVRVTKLSFDAPLQKKALEKFETKERMRIKQDEIEEFQERAKRLVQTMRVPNLTFIPSRLKTVMSLGGRLQIEQESKEQYRDLLIRHRDHLLLVLFFFKYTGHQQEVAFNSSLKRTNEEIVKIQKAIDEAEFRLHTIGDSSTSTRLGVIGLLARVEETKRETRSSVPEMDLITQLRFLTSKLKRLVKDIRSLRFLFAYENDKYALQAPRTPLPGRLIRVGSPEETDESEGGDDDYSDFKVPSRSEIKTRSYKFIHQALLKRGVH